MEATVETEEREVINPLTKDEIEYLAQYFMLFKSAYYHIRGIKLETLDQIIDLINSKEITFEDVFFVYIDKIFRSGDLREEDEIFWEDNMDKFDCQNYFPGDKRIETGAWIKIRNEVGFEIHYAKPTNRKRRFNEELEAVQSEMAKYIKNQLEDLQNDRKPRIDYKAKLDALNLKYLELKLRMYINIKPYEVKIQRNKSKVEYYMPYQYELVHDIETYSDAYVQNVPALTIKTLYTSQNNDAIFYLQSRGISKKTAEMMASLKQTYFTFNMVEGCFIYNEFLKSHIKIVSE